MSTSGQRIMRRQVDSVNSASELLLPSSTLPGSVLGTIFPSGTADSVLADSSDATGIASFFDGDASQVIWSGHVNALTVLTQVTSFYCTVRASVDAGPVQIHTDNGFPSTAATPGSVSTDTGSTGPFDFVFGPFTKLGGGFWTPTQFNAGTFTAATSGDDPTFLSKIYRFSVLAFQ